MKLRELRENPSNPSTATEEQIERLAGKLKRVPLGLTAMRIAYITDAPNGGKMVLSGNKRLRVLKKMYGEDADLPDEYFQDVTAMSEAERHEFIVSANISDGEWDLDQLLQQYDVGELNSLMGRDALDKLLTETKDADEDKPQEPKPEALESEDEDKPFVITITFHNEGKLNKFVEEHLGELKEKYDAFFTVAGGGI